VAQLNVDGSVDTGFDPGSGPNNSVRALALQSDGKLLIGGAFTNVNNLTRMRIARFEHQWDSRCGFQRQYYRLLFADRLRSRGLPDGRILIGGDFETVNGFRQARPRAGRFGRELDLAQP
jgi:hypothetical protein